MTGTILLKKFNIENLLASLLLGLLLLLKKLVRRFDKDKD